MVVGCHEWGLLEVGSELQRKSYTRERKVGTGGPGGLLGGDFRTPRSDREDFLEVVKVGIGAPAPDSCRGVSFIQGLRARARDSCQARPAVIPARGA